MSTPNSQLPNPNSQLPKKFDPANQPNFLLSSTPKSQLPNPNSLPPTRNTLLNYVHVLRFPLSNPESSTPNSRKVFGCIFRIVTLAVAIEGNSLWFSDASYGFKMKSVFEWNFTGHWNYLTSSQSLTPKFQLPKSNFQLPKASQPKKVNSQLPKKIDPANQPHISRR